MVFGDLCNSQSESRMLSTVKGFLPFIFKYVNLLPCASMWFWQAIAFFFEDVCVTPPNMQDLYIYFCYSECNLLVNNLLFLGVKGMTQCPFYKACHEYIVRIVADLYICIYLLWLCLRIYCISHMTLPTPQLQLILKPIFEVSLMAQFFM